MAGHRGGSTYEGYGLSLRGMGKMKASLYVGQKVNTRNVFKLLSLDKSMDDCVFGRIGITIQLPAALKYYMEMNHTKNTRDSYIR